MRTRIKIDILIAIIYDEIWVAILMTLPVGTLNVLELLSLMIVLYLFIQGIRKIIIKKL